MGLADALKKPVYGFDSHLCMAKAMGDWGERLFAPTTRARAGYFYSALFHFDKGPKRLTEDTELSPQNLADVITAPAIMAGEGLVGNEVEIRKSVTHDVEFINSANSSAAAGAAMLANDIARTESAEGHPPIPKYVGRSQAEINLVTNRSSTLKKGGDDGR
jgi:tRNA A37 threonylcarbamoyladenosine modification protein TsaB